MMETINQILDSGESVQALEKAVRALAGGNDALDAAIADVVTARDSENVSLT